MGLQVCTFFSSIYQAAQLDTCVGPGDGLEVLDLVQELQETTLSDTEVSGSSARQNNLAPQSGDNFMHDEFCGELDLDLGSDTSSEVAYGPEGRPMPVLVSVGFDSSVCLVLTVWAGLQFRRGIGY